MTNVRKNLIATITPSVLTNPLTLRLVGVAAIGVPNGLRLVGRGGTAPLAYAFVSGTLPTGITSVSATTGLFVGTPSAVGTFVGLYSVTDSSGVPVTRRFVLSITIKHRLTPQNSLPPNAENGQPYSYQFSVTGASGAVTYAFVGPAIGLGLTLSAAGLLSGTPISTAAAFTYTVRATDSGSPADSIDMPFTFSIVSPMVLNPSGPAFTYAVAVMGQPYTIDLSTFVRFGSPPYSFRIVSTSNFTGVAAITTAGVLTITPSTSSVVSNNSAIFLGITDSLGYAYGGANNFNFNVVAPNTALQPQRAAANVGSQNPQIVNYDGIGAARVVNDGVTMTATLGATMNAPDVSCTVPANCTAVVYKRLTLPAGIFVTLEAGAYLVILP